MQSKKGLQVGSFSVLDMHAEESGANPDEMPEPSHARVRMFLDNGEVIDETFILPKVLSLQELVAQQVSRRIAELNEGVAAADSKIVGEDHDPESPGTVKNTPALALAAGLAVEAQHE